MATANTTLCFRWMVISVILLTLSAESLAKLSENKTSAERTPPARPAPEPVKTANKVHGGSVVLFADEVKQTLERYLFGICPQNFKMSLLNKGNKNNTFDSCDVDSEHNDLAGRLAALALRAHSAARGECSQLGGMLASTFSDLARTASSRQMLNAAANDANKKRKLSKSQKAKIQAKQRTALAVKKKAAALAAAAASKIATQV
ncbi:hypothetical protein JYU34_018150 [Plutella xylostella]|uniref:Secreted protein n=1 Tax=Plutella xylostella TaxID=51655 RepID=A0ABQ7PZU9_PLUXY|nr:hypothetical protein JYU34_018150 [Plutella xylostella]